MADNAGLYAVGGLGLLALLALVLADRSSPAPSPVPNPTFTPTPSPTCQGVLSGTIAELTSSMPSEGTFYVPSAGTLELSISQPGGDLSLIYVSVTDSAGKSVWSGYASTIPAAMPVEHAGTTYLTIETNDTSLIAFGIEYAVTFCPALSL